MAGWSPLQPLHLDGLSHGVRLSSKRIIPLSQCLVGMSARASPIPGIDGFPRSSREGCAVARSLEDRSTVASTGRVFERARYRRVHEERARSSALLKARSVLPANKGWSTVAAGVEDEVGLSGWKLVTDFLEIAAHALLSDTWKTVLVKRWRYSEDIHVIEARSMVESLCRAACCQPTADRKLLVLPDNLAAMELATFRCWYRYDDSEPVVWLAISMKPCDVLLQTLRIEVRGLPNSGGTFGQQKVFSRMRQDHQPRSSVFSPCQVPIIPHFHFALWHN